MSEANKTQDAQGGHIVEITVNTKYKVTIEGPRVTGLQIKQAAKDQGVPIELDFILREPRGNKERPIIGDDDLVTVNKNSKFTATAGDDNSSE